jgi:hypothetical protein
MSEEKRLKSLHPRVNREAGGSQGQRLRCGRASGCANPHSLHGWLNPKRRDVRCRSDRPTLKMGTAVNAYRTWFGG